jgi:hypothetical protein
MLPMSYLDELEKMSVTELCKQACHRIDGITMYLVCTLFTLVAAYSSLADWFGWPLPTPDWKRLGGAYLLLFVPITFIEYISIVYYSTPGKAGRVINALFLLGIPLYFAYKLTLF